MNYRPSFRQPGPVELYKTRFEEKENVWVAWREGPDYLVIGQGDSEQDARDAAHHAWFDENHVATADGKRTLIPGGNTMGGTDKFCFSMLKQMSEYLGIPVPVHLAA